MGKSNWDRQSITDSLILNSVTHFDEPKPYLTFHRELLLSHHEAAILTGALANPAEFVALVPDFLAGWRRSDDRHGLLALANAIRAGGFLGNKAWRFGM